MWSHYAANHEGLCFQFEVAKDIGTFAHAVPVEYSDEYPVVNWIIGSEAGLLPTILRKHTGWSYELESRIVISDGARKYLRFRPEALRGLIFGCRVKDSLIAKVRELLAERSSLGWMLPILYAARQHESRYNLVIHKFKQNKDGQPTAQPVLARCSVQYNPADGGGHQRLLRRFISPI